MADNHKMRVCTECNRGFSPSSNHLRCPACRDTAYKKPCPNCNNMMRKNSKICISCYESQPKDPMSNGNWKGGKTFHKKGYVMIRIVDHPRASRNNGYVFEHILVMEEELGRYLREDEKVHHKNGIRNDNSIKNLELWTGTHPNGVRVDDLIEWAESFLGFYAPELLK